jgi:hypothetical protein
MILKYRDARFNSFPDIITAVEQRVSLKSSDFRIPGTNVLKSPEVVKWDNL